MPSLPMRDSSPSTRVPGLPRRNDTTDLLAAGAELPAALGVKLTLELPDVDAARRDAASTTSSTRPAPLAWAQRALTDPEPFGHIDDLVALSERHRHRITPELIGERAPSPRALFLHH